jgi:hypothetical protein
LWAKILSSQKFGIVLVFLSCHHWGMKKGDSGKTGNHPVATDIAPFQTAFQKTNRTRLKE